MKTPSSIVISDRIISGRTKSMPKLFKTNQKHIISTSTCTSKREEEDDDDQDGQKVNGKKRGSETIIRFYEQQQQQAPKYPELLQKLNNKPIINYGSTIRKGAKNDNINKNNYNNHGRGAGGGCGGDDDDDKDNCQQTAISDVIGSFGLFQFLILLFSGLRESLVGYDALIMSVILQPDNQFICRDNLQSMAYNDSSLGSPSTNNLTNLSLMIYKQSGQPWQANETMSQCYRSLDGGKTPLIDPASQQPVRCESWLFADELADKGPSLVADWSLVCHNHWLVAFIESAYFFGLVTGNLCWGYCADKFGRRPAYLLAHSIGLVFGSLAVVVPSIWLFTVCRFLAAFGSIGYNIIYSIQVEIIGAKHRSFSTILNHAGWGLGVIVVPIVDHLFDDYRPLIAVAPVLSLLMFPWAFWLPESCRWLMANDRFDEARRELLRAASFNGKQHTPILDKRIFKLEQKIRQDKLSQKRNSIVHLANGSIQEQPIKKSYQLIFSTRALLQDTCILSYVTFSGHLFYYLLTINFAYMKNLSTQANFIISGAGEWVSVLVGAILLKFLTRKSCMALFLLLMAASFAFQALIDSELLPDQLDTPLVITTNNGLGTLSALLLIFIVLIVNQEVYPTVVRQTGTSITNTLGETGSTLAPLLIQFSRLIGSTWANLMYAVICLIGMVAVQFVSKTDDIELQDT